jgi:hypothetical protein
MTPLNINELRQKIHFTKKSPLQVGIFRVQ